MNIFAVDNDSSRAANMLCLKHVCKMIVESTQLLSMAFDPTFLGVPYPTWTQAQFNHPCSVWTRAQLSNWEWLWNHGTRLSERYSRVYGKTHKCNSMLSWFASHGNRTTHTTNAGLTNFVLCMPEQYKRASTAVEAYRAYYIAEKAHFAKWEHLQAIPAWWPNRSNAHVRLAL